MIGLCVPGKTGKTTAYDRTEKTAATHKNTGIQSKTDGLPAIYGAASYVPAVCSCAGDEEDIHKWALYILFTGLSGQALLA